MLSPSFWLSPVAGDFLRTSSRLLQGKLPSSAANLAKLLSDASAEDCDGILGDAGVRKALADSLKSSSLKQIEADGSASALGEIFVAMLKKEVDRAEEASKPLVKKLSSAGQFPSFQDAAAATGASTETLKKDTTLWNTVAHSVDSKFTALPKDLLSKRLALAASSDGPLSAYILSVHILDNLEKYFTWEASLPPNQPQAKSQSLQTQFDKTKTQEVVVRQVLASALPADVACAVATEACPGAKNFDAVAKKARELITAKGSAAQAQAVLPRYAAPPPPKQPKDKKAKGDAPAPAAAAKGGGAGGPPGFAPAHRGTVGEELQWHIASYILRPKTALSDSKPGAGASGKRTASPTAARSAKKGATSSAHTPKGFGATWLVGTDGGDLLPPGHTPFSWQHEALAGTVRQPTPWDCEATEIPPGHTDYSWEAVSGQAPGGKSSPSASPKQKASASPKSAPAKGGAAPKAAPGGAPPEDSAEAGLCKLDLRVGHIKKIEKHPDADTLYLLKVDIGGEERQVVTGLVKHYKSEELDQRKVVVYCNIKPGKMRGLESQAMVLAATLNKGSDNEKCEVLDPGQGAKVGTRLNCAGFEVGCLSDTVNVKKISSVWSAVQPELKTSSKTEAMFKGQPLTVDGKPIKAPTIKEGPIS